MMVDASDGNGGPSHSHAGSSTIHLQSSVNDTSTSFTKSTRNQLSENNQGQLFDEEGFASNDERIYKDSKSNEDCGESEKTKACGDPPEVGAFEIWALGITVVIGGQYFSWNAGLQAGFGSFLVSTFLIGSAYVCLVLCNAELTSALPFAGGAYGLARVSLGLYPGFLIGVCEAVEYIFYVATSALVLADMMVSMTGAAEDMVPVFCLLFYVSALVIQILGDRWFWRTTVVLGIVSIVIVLVFCFGSLPWVDFKKYACAPSTTGDLSRRSQAWFVGGFMSFFRTIHLASWWYVGVESLNFCSPVVRNPKKAIPRGSISCILTLFATSLFVLFVCSSLPPPAGSTVGAVDDADATATAYVLSPLNNGFKRIFKGLSEDGATALSIPATYATAYGFVWAFGRVVHAMAESQLFPRFLKMTYGEQKIPYAALIAGSIIGYVVCLLVYFFPSVGGYIFNICVLSAFMAYISQFYGFIFMKFRHSNQKRDFHNPLGYVGAVYGALVFTFAAISVIGFQGDGHVAFIAFLVQVGVLSLYYYSYARKRQCFSDDEKFVFIAQIIKYNQRAQQRILKGRRSGRFLKNKNNSNSNNSGRGSMSSSSRRPQFAIFESVSKLLSHRRSSSYIGGNQSSMHYSQHTSIAPPPTIPSPMAAAAAPATLPATGSVKKPSHTTFEPPRRGILNQFLSKFSPGGRNSVQPYSPSTNVTTTKATATTRRTKPYQVAIDGASEDAAVAEADDPKNKNSHVKKNCDVNDYDHHHHGSEEERHVIKRSFLATIEEAVVGAINMSPLYGNMPAELLAFSNLSPELEQEGEGGGAVGNT